MPRRALTEAARCFVQAAQRPETILGEAAAWAGGRGR